MPGNVVLISTYELGRQSFGIASAAAWLRAAGASVSVEDLSVSHLNVDRIKQADAVAFYVPMHTATRLAEAALARVLEVNDGAHICFFGLYASINETHLRALGAHTVIGGEFEQGLVDMYYRLDTADNGLSRQTEPVVSLERQRFKVPDRDGMPALDRYATLRVSSEEARIVGYVEASRGCQHRCRHCPVVAVYAGRFVIVQQDVVLEDIRQQVSAGAEHITFGDPDFFNGPAHSMRIVEAMHREFPNLTYDVTVKVEHLATHAHLLDQLAATGCALVTSAVESFDDETLERFDKGHKRTDLARAIAALDAVGIPLNPTFVTFTPWTTIDGYVEFLSTLALLGLVDNMSSVQYAIRLLIPAGSKLLELQEVADLVDEFDESQLVYPWRNADPAVDRLLDEVVRITSKGQDSDWSNVAMFNKIWVAANDAAGHAVEPLLEDVPSMATIPYLTEPWFC